MAEWVTAEVAYNKVFEEKGFYVEEFVIYPTTECILIEWDGVK